MKRGEKESFCLEKVKMEMFSDLTNDALNENPHYNLDFDKNYFGLLEDERAEFVNIIREAKPNPSSSEFPDFIFADGFIEHFQITSSRHTHKGATHTKKESEFQRRVDTETKKLEEEWNKKPCFDSIRSESWAFQNPEHGGLTPLWLSRETATRKRYLWTSFWRLKRSMTRSGKRVRMAKSRRRLRAKRKQYSYAAALMNL